MNGVIVGAVAVGIGYLVVTSIGATRRTRATRGAWPVDHPDRRVARVVAGVVVDDDRSGVSGARYFGAPREGGRLHAGVDLHASAGQPIRAMFDGVVIGRASGYVGLDALVVEHASFVALYGEIAARSFAPGERVTAGQVIGTAATSSTGTELHVELWAKGYAPRSFTPWMPGRRPAGLIDPTSTLLDIAAWGDA